MYSLAKEQIVIYDLKPNNIFFKDGRAIIAGVSFAQQYEGNFFNKLVEMDEIRGDPEWMAPEVRRALISNRIQNAYLSKLDVFSLGLITLYLIDSDGFTKHRGQLNTDEKILIKYLQELENKGILRYIPVGISTALRRTLSFDIHHRISIEDLYNCMRSIEEEGRNLTKLHYLS